MYIFSYLGHKCARLVYIISVLYWTWHSIQSQPMCFWIATPLIYLLLGYFMNTSNFWSHILTPVVQKSKKKKKATPPQKNDGREFRKCEQKQFCSYCFYTLWQIYYTLSDRYWGECLVCVRIVYIYWGNVPDRFVPITCIDILSDRYWGQCLVCIRIVCTERVYKGWQVNSVSRKSEKCCYSSLEHHWAS